MTVDPKAKHSVRAHAMRIAHQLSYFNIQESEKWRRRDGWIQDVMLPDLTKWSFVDLDPLLGEANVHDKLLIDDGARAVWPVDFAFADLRGGDDWYMTYARSMKTDEARRMGLRLFSPKMLRIESVMFEDGRWNWGAGVVSLLGGKWIDPYGQPRRSVDIKEGFDKPPNPEIGNILAGIALRHRYEWSAIFSFPTGLNLRFGTTSAGALAVFRDRERGENTRRAPILHWVRQHWRRGVTTADTLREVRRHMRGQEQLVWHGIPVTLIPAEYELEQAA